jgi:hypothetical protein
MRHPASITLYGADHRNTPLAAFEDYGVLFAVAYLTVLCLALIPLAVSVPSLITLLVLAILLCSLAAFETVSSREFRRALRGR